ncbi:MAG: hypothetical protein LLF94_02860, partial [Chlamydiales bacterium]|nr:hypothetical protein [Chlamydiales bacterium]
MDVGSTQRFGTLLPLPLSPQTVEQEPLTEEERFRRAFEKDLRISPKSAPPQSSNVGARLAGRSMSCNDGSLGTMIKTKRTSLPAFMPTTEELPKRKGSLLDRLRPSKPEPEMQNRYIESLLKYDEWLLDSTEIL